VTAEPGAHGVPWFFAVLCLPFLAADVLMIIYLPRAGATAHSPAGHRTRLTTGNRKAWTIPAGAR